MTDGGRGARLEPMGRRRGRTGRMAGGDGSRERERDVREREVRRDQTLAVSLMGRKQ